MVVDLGFCPRCGSPLNPCDGNVRHRSCCSVCGNVVYNNPYPVAVATIVRDDSALLVKRARAPEKGCWSFPGGYLEMDEVPEVTAARELSEETGLYINPDDLEYVGTDYENLDGPRSVVDIIYAAPIERTRGELAPGDDAEDAQFWSRYTIDKNPHKFRMGDPAPIIWAINQFAKPSSEEQGPFL